ncbi:ketopantoate reductase family protein [Streptomyces sp. TRM66268-LWL]|uniref:2-dehydropantoate 2-reductase n=1 Tax=Streptomyces polyasparticus TaxID=2767826 RepID=A0ABR7SQE9_9ACTN|nr:ketopantoate reductase family protein [Streptomyces polyasparticus]MBC9717720.1 ketopantoate reductase family protein [Streptomyces polyasparticus]
MKILVVGAGATGGWFGALLARADRDVTFLVRPGRAEVLRSRGLRITGKGTEDWEPLTPQLVLPGEVSQPYDLILLAVKASALDAAIESIRPAVGPSTVIMPFLNGLAHVDRLSAEFGADAVFGGVVKVVTALTPEGDIVRLAPLSQLTFGEQAGGMTKRVEAVREVLDVPGIDAVASADVLEAMWAKWAFITTIGALTCLGRGTVGDVNAVPGGPSLGPALLAETSAIAAAAGHPVPPAELSFTETVVTTPDSPLVPSLYRDVIDGRSTEAEHLFGDLTARARELDVPTPLLDLATLQLRVHEYRVARGQAGEGWPGGRRAKGGRRGSRRR